MGDEKIPERETKTGFAPVEHFRETFADIIVMSNNHLVYPIARQEPPGRPFGSQPAANGSAAPLEIRLSVSFRRMNQQLAEHRIRSTCRELIATGSPVTGRAVRRVLRDRFGAVGRTARVFQILREEAAAMARPAVPPDVAELERRLQVAEAAALENQARAERAEYREQAHQDHWAIEIDRLREDLKARPKYAVEIRALQDQVLRLTAELQAARSQLADLSL